MAVDVGSAYVTIIPDMSRFAAEVRTDMHRAVMVAAELAGIDGGARLMRGITQAVQRDASQIQTSLTNAAQQAGQQAGQAAGQGIQQGVNQGAEDAGRSMGGILAAAGLAAGALLGVSIFKAMEHELAKDKLAGSLGATPELAKKYGKLAGELYNDAYGESFEDVTGAIGVVVSSFEGMRNASDKDIKAVTANALDFAKAFEIDVARAASVAGTAVNDGIAVDAKGALDLFTVALQKTPAALRENVLDAIEEYGAYFKSFGFSGEQAMGILVEAAKKGQFGIDKIGDAIKESQLLMTDIGAKPVQDAYKAIGLDAEKMSASILKGGTSGQEAFQKIVKGLLSIKDPNEQAAASIALFGTPLEDMNKEKIPEFLTALSAGATGLGDVKGAADEMGKTLNDNATTDLESFKRQVESAFVSFLGEKALPFVKDVARELKENFGPAVSTIADGLKSAWEWLVKHQDIVIPLAAALGGMAAPILAVAAAMKLWAIAQGIWTAITTTATAIQTAWNASLFANPIGIVVLAVVALIAAVVAAYYKVDWFREMVDKAWKWIKESSIALWDGYLKPAFEAIRAFIMDKLVPAALWLYEKAIKPAWAGIQKAIGVVWDVLQVWFAAMKWWFLEVIAPAVMWLWENVMKPAWEGIKVAIDVAWVVIKAIFEAIKWYIDKVLIPVFTFLYENVIKPVWAAIKLAIDIAWAAIQIIWGAIQIYIKAVLIPIFEFLYNNVIKPVWEGIKKAIDVAWSLIKVIWDAIKWYIDNVLVPVFNWLKDKITTIWNGIKDAISKVWNEFIKPTLDAVGKFIEEKVQPAFKRGVDAIGTAWDKLKDLAKKPVEFVVNSVINPLIRGFNSIAGKFGVGKVDEIQGFATGGKVWGPGTATSDSIPAMLSRGEHVWTAKEVQAAGGHGAVMALRNKALHQHLPHFADGGIVDWFRDPVGMAKKKFGGFLDKLKELDKNDFANMVAEMPKRIYNGILEKVKGWLSFGGDDGASYGAGPGFPPWPARHPGSGGGYGDQGVWRSIVALIRSTGPLSGSFGNGYRPGDPLWHGAGRAVDWMGYNQDALASFLASLRPLELIHRTNSRDYAYTRGQNRGSFSAGLMQAHRNHIHIAMDSGGWLQPGMSSIWNGTGKPEAVFTNDQWQVLRVVARQAVENSSAGPAANAGDTHYHLHDGQATITQLEALQRRQEVMTRSGRPR